jgi:hypothetical protein
MIEIADDGDFPQRIDAESEDEFIEERFELVIEEARTENEGTVLRDVRQLWRADKVSKKSVEALIVHRMHTDEMKDAMCKMYDWDEFPEENDE